MEPTLKDAARKRKSVLPTLVLRNTTRFLVSEVDRLMNEGATCSREASSLTDSNSGFAAEKVAKAGLKSTEEFESS